MVLPWILIATFVGGVVSVAAAACLTMTLLRNVASKLVSFSVGALLAAALLDLLPEALSLLNSHAAGMALLGGLLVFFTLEKLALLRHDHGGTAHPVGAMIVVGDGLHNFVDGILIAGAFLQDLTLGMSTAFAVIAHEVPQEMGDFIVLLSIGYSRGRALLLNALSGVTMIAGGVLGYFWLQSVHGAIPYCLVVAAASFLYIAIADLIPLLQRERRPIDFATQLACLFGGAGLVSFTHS